MHQQNIFFFKTTRSILTKLDTKHPCEVFVCLNEGSRPLLRNSKNTLTNFKNLLLQNHWAKIGTKHPWMIWKQCFTDKDHSIFKRRYLVFLLPNRGYDIIISAF